MIKRTALQLCGISLAMSLAFVVAFWSHVLTREPRALNTFAAPAASGLQLRGSTVEAVIEPDLLVASSIGKAYHRPDCFYAARQTKHVITFKSKAEDEASGRHACSNCFPAMGFAAAVSH
jgi:hypothetical protein